jgi:phosphatidylcholine synthase
MPWGAAAAHAFTALGSVVALLAMLCVFDGAWERMFGWLGLAFFIDGIDGTFARMARVTERLPRFSGERLDLVVDYLTYVFIPVLALLRAGYLPGALGMALAFAILLTSLFHFADMESKAEDNSFIGFPAIWNIVAFYIFAFGVPFWLAAGIIIAGIAMTFVPWRWVHPLRVVALRPLTLAMTVLWSLAAGWTIAQGFPAGWIAGAVLIVVLGYGLALCVARAEAPHV